MSAGAQGASLGPAAVEVLVRGLGVLGAPVAAWEASAFGFGVPVTEDSTVGLGETTDGVGDGLCHALPYAADGSPSSPWAAAPDEEVVTLDRAAADAGADGAGWALPNRQASTASTARPPPRIKNRRRQ